MKLRFVLLDVLGIPSVADGLPDLFYLTDDRKEYQGISPSFKSFDEYYRWAIPLDRTKAIVDACVFGYPLDVVDSIKVPSFLAAISKHISPQYRARVALNPKTPKSVLSVLSIDLNESVRFNVALNKKCPHNTRIKILESVAYKFLATDMTPSVGYSTNTNVNQLISSPTQVYNTDINVYSQSSSLTC